MDGAALHRGAALSVLGALQSRAAEYPADRAGIRLHGDPVFAAQLRDGPVHTVAAHYLGVAARPVRAILFDKTPAANWALGWHQDRPIAVEQRHDVAGFGPWSRKAGMVLVEPPFELISAMVTLRVHLDDVPHDNAPLLIAPGSHRMGRIPEPDIADTVTRCGSYACLAKAGDIWAYATAILHASAPAQGRRHRRVLQVDYSVSTLPAPLVWRGV